MKRMMKSVQLLKMQYEGDIVATNFTIQSKFVPKSVFAPYKGSEDGDEFIDLKLPSTIRIQPTAFDKATYQIEDPLHVKNDNGQTQIKASAVDDFIRYRFTTESTSVDGESVHPVVGLAQTKGHEKIETNTKIVQWSDGTYSLAIGDEYFDLNIEKLTTRQIFAQHEHYALYKGKAEKRMIIKPRQGSTRAQSHFIKKINEDAVSGDKTDIVVGQFIKKQQDLEAKKAKKAEKSAATSNKEVPVKESEEHKELQMRGRGKKKMEEESEEEEADSDYPDDEDYDAKNDEDQLDDDDDDEGDDEDAEAKAERRELKRRKRENKRQKLAPTSESVPTKSKKLMRNDGIPDNAEARREGSDSEVEYDPSAVAAVQRMPMVSSLAPTIQPVQQIMQVAAPNVESSSSSSSSDSDEEGNF
ncbi:hypothetical protein FGO68_gene14112 [Halteria grandinella]|uniref:Uncharacterized protein n=1 Tax=Halteria grandinella TaxID=5974 RepID=A0A8J8NPM5_HALGN|nr:hypothetical protein FGO68_gene14112 [Halteria grandinella]